MLPCVLVFSLLIIILQDNNGWTPLHAIMASASTSSQMRGFVESLPAVSSEFKDAWDVTPLISLFRSFEKNPCKLGKTRKPIIMKIMHTRTDEDPEGSNFDWVHLLGPGQV